MDSLLIALIPVFLICMLAEYAYGARVGKNTYAFNDTLVNLALALMSGIAPFVTKFFQIGIYTLVYDGVWGENENVFWSSWLGLICGLLVFDFCDYWLHRAEHESAVLWAAHVVHHQSPNYNFSVALRQVTTEPLLGFVFYLPMALIGMPPEQLLLTALLVLLYQFFLHTDHVQKLGWLEYVMNTPSSHRVHHAVNDLYIDKNYGIVTIIWDRLFGTYQAETEPCRYGTVTPFTSHNPVWANAIEYVSIWKKVRATSGVWNKIRAIFRYPGWVPDNYEVGTPSSPLSSGHTGARVAVIAQFLVIGVLAVALMAQESPLEYSVGVGVVVAIVALCGCLGALIENKLSRLVTLALNVFAVALCVYWLQL